jgi:hypothetical protein
VKTKQHVNDLLGVGRGAENLPLIILQRCPTFVTLSKVNGGDAKTISDQAGHDVGVSVRDYAQTPITLKRSLVNELENLVFGPK